MKYTIEIDIQKKILSLIHASSKETIKSYPINTSKQGAGELAGSYCTPRGRHIIRAKIGADQPINAVFKGRRPTGEIYQVGMCDEFPKRDWVLTRIFWLSGQERGKNRLGNVDTMRRYIYIHGCPDEYEIEKNSTIGCINMRNRDLAELFDLVPVYTPVLII